MLWLKKLRWLRSQGDRTLVMPLQTKQSPRRNCVTACFREGLLSVVVADVLLNKAQGCSTSRKLSFPDVTLLRYALFIYNT
jgi:hypothetical protein